jgi:hypothetical protein
MISHYLIEGTAKLLGLYRRSHVKYLIYHSKEISNIKALKAMLIKLRNYL